MESVNNNSDDYVDSNYMDHDSPQRHSIFPPKKYILLCAILLIVFLFFAEKAIASIFYYFIPSYTLLILALIILNLFLLRLILMTTVFPGRSSFINFYMRSVMSRIRAKSLFQSLTKFESKVDQLIQLRIAEEGISSGSQILSKSRVTSKFYEIYNEILKRYGKLSPYSQNFYDHLSLLKSKIENSSLQENFKKLHRKEQINISEKENKDFQEIKDEVHKIKDILTEVIGGKSQTLEGVPHYVQNLINNDILRSKEFSRVYAILKKPLCEEIKIQSIDNIKLDCLLIFSNNKGERSNSTNLIIVCGPNLTSFENLINSWDIDNLYLLYDIDVLFWNYRGYGFSEGSANFDNIRDDVLSVYDYITSKYNYNKVGVHGLSIGGIAACHLASKRENINLLIADRTFGSSLGVINNFPLAKYITYLGKILFISLVDNSKNFMNAKCNKILLNDVEDKTVTDPISLKTTIAQNIIFEIFNIKYPELNPRNIKSVNILDYALEINQPLQMYNAFKYTISFLKNKSQRGQGNYSYEGKMDRDDKNQMLNEYFEDNFNIGKGDNKSMKEFVDLFYEKIKNIYNNFCCVGDSFERFGEYQNNKVHFDNFFNSLVIFGPEDIALKQYTLCNTHYTENELNKFISEADNLLNSDEAKNFAETELYQNFHFLNDCMKNIKTFVLSLHMEEKENEWIKQCRGLLIPLYCGHISFYDEKEFETLKYLVKETFSNNANEMFVPSLEDNNP